eukprot:COSAG05_NODE_884_length_6764_cov_4.360840_6_plen_79_part_00
MTLTRWPVPRGKGAEGGVWAPKGSRARISLSMADDCEEIYGVLGARMGQSRVGGWFLGRLEFMAGKDSDKSLIYLSLI